MFYQFKHSETTEYFRKEYDTNFSFPVHLHNSFEFITVTEGEMTVTVDNTAYMLKSGDSVLVFPNQLHSLGSTCSKHMLCIFSCDMVKTYHTKISKKIPEDNRMILDKYLKDAIDKLLSDASVIEEKGILYLLCAQFDKNAHYKEKNNMYDNLLYEMFDFVEQNYNHECSLRELSNKTGYSYSYLSRSFKKITGTSFNSYVNQYRTRNACYLLNNTDYSVIRCAMESGYKSLRSFNRNFMASFGRTPSEYREHNKTV